MAESTTLSEYLLRLPEDVRGEVADLLSKHPFPPRTSKDVRKSLPLDWAEGEREAEDFLKTARGAWVDR